MKRSRKTLDAVLWRQVAWAPEAYGAPARRCVAAFGFFGAPGVGWDQAGRGGIRGRRGRVRAVGRKKRPRMPCVVAGFGAGSSLPREWWPELVEAWAQAQFGPPAPGHRPGSHPARAGVRTGGPAALAARLPIRGPEGLRLGMLRLPAETAQRLNLVAQELGIASAEVLRRAVEVSLSHGF
jgi:hypothetical protein